MGAPNEGHPERVAIDAEDVRLLFRRVDLEGLTGVLDPWSGVGTVGRVLSGAGFKLWRNELEPSQGAESHRDALQPGFYRWARDAWGFEAIVTAPWPELLDLAIPLAVRFSPIAAFCVPGEYMASVSLGRREYLEALGRQGRLAVLTGLPRGPVGRRCLWVVVFATKGLRERRLRPCLGLDELWALI